MIVCLDLRVSLDHHRLAIANQAAKRHITRQLQVFHRLAGNLGTGPGHKLRNISVSEGQALDVGNVSVQQELVNMARGDQLLIDHRTNIHTVGHRDIIDILDLGNSLEYTKTLRRQAGQDIGTRVLGQSDKSLRILDALLD